MEERTEDRFKVFEKKKVVILTKRNFTYHTDSLEVFSGYISFKDKFGNPVTISNEEIRLIEVERSW